MSRGGLEPASGPYLNTSQGLLVRDHDDGEHEVAGAGNLAGPGERQRA